MNNRCAIWVTSVLLASGGAALAGEMPERVVQVDVQAQPMIDALNQLATQTGVRIVFYTEVTSGVTAPRLVGSYTPEEALRELLKTSDLEYTFTNSRTVEIRSANKGLRPTAQASEDGTIRMAQAKSNAPLEVHTASSARGTSTASADDQVGREEVDEVVVRGTLDLLSFGKEEQTLRNIPQSVSILTRQRMDDQNISTVEQALNNTVGIFAHDQGDGGGSVNAYARGNLMGAQFDGVAGSRSVAMGDSQFDLAIYDRIEVLRGPAGLATGVGELGGTVNMIRKRPRGQLGGAAAVTVGSWNNLHGDVDFTGPLNASGSLRARAVLAGENRDYFYDRADKQSGTAYGIVEFDLTPATTMGLSVGVQRTKLTPTTGQPLYLYSDGTYSLLGAPRSVNLVTDWSEVKRNIDEQVLDLVHRFGNDWKLKVNANRRSSLLDYRTAEPSSPVDPATDEVDFWAANWAIDYDSFGLDINVSGPLELFGRRHEVLLGFNVDDFDRAIPWGGASLGSLNAFNPGVDASVTPVRTFSLGSKVNQHGFYGMVRISLLDPLSLILGGRLSDYSDAARGFAPIDTPAPWEDGLSVHGEFTPYAGVVWDISRQFSWYGSYTEVFQPQGEFDYQGRLLDPRVGYQVETGVKGEHFGGRLNTSLAVFRLRDSNRATPDIDPAHPCFNGGVCYTAAGLIETEGWETEIVGRPLKGWDLMLGYTAYKQTDALTGEAFNTRIPDHVLKLWSNYRFDGTVLGSALQGWNVGVGLHTQNRVYVTEGAPAVTIVEGGGYTVADVQVGYRVNSKVRATLTVSNLFDREYLAAVWGPDGRNMYGAPRSAMLAVRAEF